MITVVDLNKECSMIKELEVEVRGAGMVEISSAVQGAVAESGVSEGLCTLFVRHTSASLTIQENADPSCQRDLEQWISRLVPAGDALYTHTSEGEDDMPAHIKSALTQTSIGIPFLDGRLMLGTWQGIFLWEHRHGSHRRRVAIHLNH